VASICSADAQARKTVRLDEDIAQVEEASNLDAPSEEHESRPSPEVEDPGVENGDEG